MTAAQKPPHDPPSASWDLPPSPAAVAAARHELVPLLGGCFSPTQQDDVKLLVSELVTNAILYTHAPIRLSARVSPQCLHVEVADASSNLPEVREATGSTGGWGLFLVNELASRWGAQPTRDGKQVWFELDRVPSTGTGQTRRHGAER